MAGPAAGWKRNALRSSIARAIPIAKVSPLIIPVGSSGYVSIGYGCNTSTPALAGKKQKATFSAVLGPDMAHFHYISEASNPAVCPGDSGGPLFRLVFRCAVRLMGFDFGVGIQSSVRVVRLDRLNRARGEATTVLDLTVALGRKSFRKITWRSGSKAKLSSRFCFVRVKTSHDDGRAVADREPFWLVAEWLDGEETKITLNRQ